MASPFIRTDAEGNFLDGLDGKSIAASGRYLSSLKTGTIAAAPSEIAHHASGTLPGSLGSETYDLVGVSLTAGQSYSFAYRGTPTGGVEDPYLALFGPGFTYIDEDDDGGLGRSSQITYTATETGTHYLYVTSWYHVDPSAPGYPTYRDSGNYTIDVWSQNLAHDAGSTRATAVTVGVGTTYAYLDAPGDRDMYKISTEAGMVYSFTYNGGISSGGDWEFPTTPGESIGWLDLFDAGGNYITSAANYETGLTFFSEKAGTYYVRVEGYEADMIGGYTLDVEKIDPATRNPLESLDWDTAANVPFTNVNGVKTAYVYFAPAGENFGEKADDGVTPMTTYGWEAHQSAAVMSALEHYERVLGVNYEITTDSSKATFRLMTTNSTEYGAYFYPQDPDYGTQKGIGVFNLQSGGFGTRPESLKQGGFSYAVILHEFGHAHGIAHPHDDGGDSEVMLGVTDATGSYGVYNLNQGVYTVMSYNDAWEFHPDGPTTEHPEGRIGAVIDRGWSGGLSAFDVAILQKRYGVSAYNEGNNTYTLNDNYKDAFYQTIWDSAGNDTIAYGGALDAQIDLTAATLDYTPTGGGVISFLYNSAQPDYTTEIKGGYTIANGVVIENATGGSGNDALIGNSANNVLTGNAGNDVLVGRDGNDILRGGAGNDVLNGGDGLDVITLGAGNDVFMLETATSTLKLKTGTMAVDIITDFDGSGDDLIDLAALGRDFVFRGTSANKAAGDLTYKTYGNINAAENVLGFDIDGVAGAAGVGGPVTVVYGNIDGGAVDFALILLNSSNVAADDFGVAAANNTRSSYADYYMA